MQRHLIIDLLGIQDKHVDIWHIEKTEKGYEIQLYTKQKQQKCPHCKARTKRIHAYRWQPVQAILEVHQPVTIQLCKTRYLCTTCEKTFMEKLQFVDRYQRCTNQMQSTALVYAGTQSFTQAARHAGITTNRLIRMFDRQTIPTTKVLPKILSVDEFKGDAEGEKFQTVIVDAENSMIVDVLPDRKIDTIKAYLRSCDTSQVEVVVMDLSQAFKKAIRDVLGDPLIVADRFHYMRHVYWALDQVRREVQRSLSKKERIRMKRSKKLLWKSPKALDEEGKEKVQQIIAIDPRLKEAYELKNRLDHWFKTSDKKTVKRGMNVCIKAMETSTILAFERVAQMFKRWGKEILHSFIYPYSNGITEGINNTIKVLKRLSFGIRSFQRLHDKILWQQQVKQILQK